LDRNNQLAARAFFGSLIGDKSMDGETAKPRNRETDEQNNRETEKVGDEARSLFMANTFSVGHFSVFLFCGFFVFSVSFPRFREKALSAASGFQRDYVSRKKSES
jgi:hypothetical protein